MPEITDWSNAVRHNQFYRPVKQQTSIRLDADVLAWFKAQGKGYQTRMNEMFYTDYACINCKKQTKSFLLHLKPYPSSAYHNHFIDVYNASLQVSILIIVKFLS